MLNTKQRITALAAILAAAFAVSPKDHYYLFGTYLFSNLSRENDVMWAKRVAEGGYILHFRHAQREKWNDVTAFDAVELLNNYSPDQVPFKRATCLTEEGEQEAKLLGEVLRAGHVQIGKIVSSPSCRSQQTAMHAFGRIDGINNSLLHRTAIPDRQHVEFNKEFRRLILSMGTPEPGKNNVLSGHGGTMRLDSGIVIDQNETNEGLDDRDETGMVVLEVVKDKIIARYKFRSMFMFSNAAIELPVLRKEQVAATTK